jgi:hypothetical protein
VRNTRSAFTETGMSLMFIVTATARIAIRHIRSVYAARLRRSAVALARAEGLHYTGVQTLYTISIVWICFGASARLTPPSSTGSLP